VFERAEGQLNPTAPAPGPDQARRRERRVPAQQVEALSPWLVDQEECDPAIGGTRGRVSSIAHPWHLQAVPPGPVGRVPEILSRYAASVRQLKDMAAFPLHEQRGVLVQGHLCH